jgi:predicted metal-dependent hydrolase
MPFRLNPSDFREGLELFNTARFFEAHEVLEDLWRGLPGDRPSRKHLQGLVQMAVAFHHWTTGNIEGSRSVLERALRNLTAAESSLPDIDLGRLRSEAEAWLRYLEHLQHIKSGLATAGRVTDFADATPPLPVIRWRSMKDSAL